jgi:uncharacterized protein
VTDGSRGLEPGRAAFNRGAYFEAHELWEDAWRELEGAERTLVQGLIQIAAGLHHLRQDRPRPAAGLLRKGLEKLSLGPRDPEPSRAPHEMSAPFADLAVDGLARDVARVLAALEEPGATTAVPDASTLKL